MFSQSSFLVHVDCSAQSHLTWFLHPGQTQEYTAASSNRKRNHREIGATPHLSLSKKHGLVLCHLIAPWQKRALARRAVLQRQLRATYPTCVECSQILTQPVLTHPPSPLTGRAELFSITLEALWPYQ